ncbi:MAG: DMT family transporter [Pseudomonadota bacterium]
MADQSVSEPLEEDGLRRSVVIGMGMMAFAMLLLPVMDAIAKTLSTQYDVTAGQTTFGRFAVQACLFFPVIIFLSGWRGLIPKHIGINLLRGALMGTAVMLFFAALKYMPIADALAVFFLEPFILTVLSAVVLRESVGWRRWAACAVGFAGAMLILRPGLEVFGPVSLMPIGTAFLFAVYLLLTRRFAGDDNPMAMQFVSGIGGVFALGFWVVLATAAGVDDFASTSVPEFGIRWGLIFTIGAIATIGHLLVVMAFARVSASVLAPFQYLEIVMATLLGYWLFAEFPDGQRWVGIFIIIASGIYLFNRERKTGTD